MRLISTAMVQACLGVSDTYNHGPGMVRSILYLREGPGMARCV